MQARSPELGPQRLARVLGVGAVAATKASFNDNCFSFGALLLSTCRASRFCLSPRSRIRAAHAGELLGAYCGCIGLWVVRLARRHADPAPICERVLSRWPPNGRRSSRSLLRNVALIG